MPHRGRDTVTVSPPTFDRTAFARVDAALPAGHAPLERDWLMARFNEGLQIRMLKPPFEGLVIFQPGKLAWRPVEGADRALFVHDLRIAPGLLAKDGAARLWAVAEGFARYYGLSAVLALIGRGPGLIAPEIAPPRGWFTLDEAPSGARLVGRVLQGPLSLPHLPRDWEARAAALGPGVTIQTTGECTALEDRARRMLSALDALRIPARQDRPSDAQTLQARAVRPGAVFSVVVDGRLIGGPEVTLDQILDQLGGGQRPS
jgi:hypothetical protein